MTHVEFLIIGAGPYGIATAAYAKSLGLDVSVVGKPLDSWKTNMPPGMFLRSGSNWHLDALEAATFEAYVNRRALAPEQVKPLPLALFVDYASWFMGQYDVVPRRAHVTHLQRATGVYTATLDDGSQIRAEQVLLGLGFAFFRYFPRELIERLPPHSYSHTCDAVDFEFFRGKRVLVVGGRQSAFESAALMAERGADEIHVVHRHATPKFTPSDWSWVQPMTWRTLDDHGWWRKLAHEEQARIRDDFWAAGRLTLEPWLDARVHRPNIHIHERTVVVAGTSRKDLTFDVSLDDGSIVNVHHVLLATGYRPEMRSVAFLDRATIRDPLETVEGYPVLDTEFQANLPGLYVTGLAATRDFGPFFGFTVACPVAARIIGDRVASGRLGDGARTRLRSQLRAA